MQHVRIVQKLNSFAWRVWHQSSTLVQILAGATRVYATKAATATTESARTCLVQARTGLNGKHPVAPACHLELIQFYQFGGRLALLQGPESDSPELEDFHLFAALPTELRLLVWQYDASFERVVEIQYINRTLGLRHSASQ